MFQEIILVTGFLGSGKTYFIQQILSQKPQQRWGLIVNDFGKHNIDMALLAKVSKGVPAYPISNGCICCSAKDGLKTALDYLKQQELKHIIIEASGLFNGAEISNLAAVTQNLKIVCLMDSRDILHNKALNNDAKAQIEISHALILSHMDKLDSLTAAEVQSKASYYHPTAIILTSEQQNLWEALEQLNRMPVGKHHKQYEHDIMQKDIQIPLLNSKDDLEYLLYLLSSEQFGQIIRAKGFIKVENKPYLLQLNYYEYTVTPIEDNDSYQEMHNQLSVFGYQLKADMLQSAIKQMNKG
ncbi:MAG: GTP-binding protein [Alphaproteobacteria bacterium]